MSSPRCIITLGNGGAQVGLIGRRSGLGMREARDGAHFYVKCVVVNHTTIWLKVLRTPDQQPKKEVDPAKLNNSWVDCALWFGPGGD